MEHDVGDGPAGSVRLGLPGGDVEITEDRSGGPGLAGDEAVFGGGKVLRESMGQGRATRADGAPDTVITGVVIIDHWGIIKADIGIRDGRIAAIGKAGNPDVMSGVHPDLVVGPSTEIIAGNGRIVTAGGIDCHVHLICPQIKEEALGGGITTIIDGGGVVNAYSDWSFNVSRPVLGMDMNLMYSGSSLTGADCSAYSGHNTQCESTVTLKVVRSFF